MSEGSQFHRSHPLSQYRNHHGRRFDDPISENKSQHGAFEQLSRRQSSAQGVMQDDNTDDRTSNGRGSSPSYTSFTQRRLERGGNVPSSFTSFEFENNRPLSSSAGSVDNFDSSAYYGLSPFVTSSFMDIPVLERSSSRYRSLSHRYLREQFKGGNGYGYDEKEEDDIDDEGNIKNNISGPSSSPDHQFSHRSRSGLNQSDKKGHEDSDIELSDDDEDGKERDLLFHMDGHKSTSRFDVMNPASYEGHEKDEGIAPHHQYHQSQPIQSSISSWDPHEIDAKPKVSPAYARITEMLTNYQPKENIQGATQTTDKGKINVQPPRRHLLQTPVFQVVNANTLKDRYLFLFNDLLLICKPILDENIIDNTSAMNQKSAKDGKYRLRHNENSLFQVKNIVELSKITLYLPNDEQPARHRSSIMLDRSGRMGIYPPRKMHPVLATALHKFEEDPESAIAYLVEKQVLSNEPFSIANFLFKTPDLCRRQLGYYIADHKNGDIYDAFLDCFRMVALRLDEALRILLMTLRLPSKWEALEYVIERFAKKWHDANQNVVKFHEDMVVKVVVAMLFLNAEFWYDADSSRDVFWSARAQKERKDRQRLLTRRASMIDRKDERGSVAIEPLHYISALRAKKGTTRPSLEEFLDRWRYYDQYALVPVEFCRDMYQSIASERLETGWDNSSSVTSACAAQPAQDSVITLAPYQFPSSLTKGIPSAPITITIPAPDAGLQIKLRGQDLICTPSVLDFSKSSIQTFTITGHTLGRTSLMFIKSGPHANRYLSPNLPRTKSIVVERPLMRYTFEISFSHADMRAAAAVAALKSPANRLPTTDQEPMMVNRHYMFSVESEHERKEWVNQLKELCGHVQMGAVSIPGKEVKTLSSEERVALQVLKEVLLADEFKKGTANLTALKLWGRSSILDAGNQINNSAKDITATSAGTTKNRSSVASGGIDSSKHDETTDRNSLITAKSTANVVTKRGHEIIKLVVQNSMVPLMLGFLRKQIPQ
ncbi:hypothetical protein BX666DRAFT_2021709 [Dichotomocladium elegans]|nr:hypothetical protein BX666DRAFT_2021709 [Dichotomocladium elegans]